MTGSVSSGSATQQLAVSPATQQLGPLAEAITTDTAEGFVCGKAVPPLLQFQILWVEKQKRLNR